jgi:uncharacterized protein DUF4062
MQQSRVPQIKILISSTRADLAQYREEASRVVNDVAEEKKKWVQLVDKSMEKQTQSGEREFAVAVSKRWVEECDWVIVIVGWNYGTVSDEPDANGLSVTEWEYRHALELGKTVFVFMAGDPHTADEYRFSPGEVVDLKNWGLEQTPQQTAKLASFKRELDKPFVAKFANLQAFRKKLERTLKNKIDDLIFPDVKPGTPLAEVIMSVLPSIRDCIRRVTLIADCKRIHDHLHELRQHVIRPLREEVLSMWKQEGTLSMPRERVIWQLMSSRSEATGGLRQVRSSMSPDYQALLNTVDAVVKRLPLWNVKPDSPESPPSREDFTETVEDFAVEVQDAFDEADKSMAREEGNLRERYLKLHEDLKRAQQQRKLGPKDQQRLEDELEKVDANRSRVKESLTSHHSWQEAHNKLHETDSYREDGGFERKLNHYRKAPLANLLSLVDLELEQAGALQASGVGSEHARVAEANQGASVHGPDLEPAFVAFADDLRHLKESLERLREGAGLDAFDKMRRVFDDAFYYVDKRTLREVEQAHERVRKLEDWLNGLAAAQQKTA